MGFEAWTAATVSNPSELAKRNSVDYVGESITAIMPGFWYRLWCWGMMMIDG